MNVKLIVRKSLPQDIEPIAKNIISGDLEKLNLYGYSKGTVRDRITLLISGETSYTVSSESGAIGFAYGLLDTIESCKLPEGGKIAYVPLWILETTILTELEKEFF
jgi:hypothetical protein